METLFLIHRCLTFVTRIISTIKMSGSHTRVEVCLVLRFLQLPQQTDRSRKNKLAALNILRGKQNRSSASWKVIQKAPVALETKTTSIVTSTPDIPVQVIDTKWSILPLPGLSLVNTLNKCWFHASLHFLSCIYGDAWIRYPMLELWRNPFGTPSMQSYTLIAHL